MRMMMYATSRCNTPLVTKPARGVFKRNAVGRAIRCPG
jgi:hypothetical protein